MKNLLNFWNFVNIKVAKFKSNHLGFYCKLDFFDRTIRKIRNWNRNWVLTDETPCICMYMYFLFPKIFCFIFIEWYHDMKLMYLCNLNLKSIKEYDRRKLFIPLWVHWKAHLTKTIFNVLSTFYSIEFSIY